jgi:DNA-3-methyladenine glycosylase II
MSQEPAPVAGLMSAAMAHLQATHPGLADLIERHGPCTIRPRSDPYASLVRSIMYQQLAGPAAAAIERRFFALYGDPGRLPRPEEVLATPEEDMRSAGVSRQKSGYLRDLAVHIVEGRLDFSGMDGLSDDEVAARLTAVKGIGEWTAHMFLMFELGRLDVLPVGDLGVRNGMRIVYRLDRAPTPKEARLIGEPWAPYRSVGAWYMWRAVEGANETW